MNDNPPFAHADLAAAQQKMQQLMLQLYPICRSITGPGVRESLALLQQHIPLEIKSVASGTKVLDWIVPDEWQINDAYIKDASGKRVVDFTQHNLHVMSYSQPVNRVMSLDELQPHLHSIPGQPDWIPYKTSYYQTDWGFCLTHKQRQKLKPGQYEVCIDSSLKPGVLNYAELLIKGKSTQEILISTHICHPSMANDNLSGVVVATALASYLQKINKLHYSYRFVFVPGTIGAICWLAQQGDNLRRIQHGLVLSGLGDSGTLTYKNSRSAETAIDKVMAKVVHDYQGNTEPFSPYGYDERQYCSPGFNLPVGRLSRTPFGTYPEYHTSADDLQFVKPQQLGGALQAVIKGLQQLESQPYYINSQPYAEPCLSKYGLYDDDKGKPLSQAVRMALLWVLNLADGQHDLAEMAEQSGLALHDIEHAADKLKQVGLLKE
ncbi:DUF4910 domain-containing protein [Neptunicella marina]|uniref:DUF4910 domain-containing protein n=1 Tax=Neptunicella marina TaxID=2125989 RepID=A0A8J6ITF5_9ALTE|nr:DUF4910 domain-containing protein [Neptunicella marina]MBC3765572.1 DUF4910 domain-containing protein [Neptunicella marina]